MSKSEDNGKEQKICEKHNVPIEIYYPGATIEKTVHNEDGSIRIEDVELELERCPECEYEKDFNSPYPDIVEEAIDTHRRKEKPLKLNPHTENFIIHYTPKIHELTGEPEYICQAALEWIVGVALCDLNYVDNIGRVRTNLMIRLLQQTSERKTALYRLIKRIVRELVGEEFMNLARGTPKGWHTYLTKPMKGVPYTELSKALLMKDEETPIFIDSRSTPAGDMIFFFSQAWDGIMESNATVTHGYTPEKPVFLPVFLAGVPDASVSYIQKIYFKQGVAQRFIHLYERNTDPKWIAIWDTNLPKIKGMVDEMLRDLREMKKLNVAKTASGFMEAYNSYCEPIDICGKLMKARTDVDDLSLEYMEATMPTKVPEYLLKFSMIYAASRFHTDGTGNLIMDLEDLEIAKERFELYMRKNIDYFKFWLSNTEDFKDVNLNVQKVLRLVADAEVRYSFRRVPEKGDSVQEYYIVTPDKSGKWVKHSPIFKRMNMDKMRFEPIVEKAIDTGQLFKRELNVPLRPEKDGTTKINMFAKLILYMLPEKEEKDDLSGI
ncbi:MAG: hypothetical protein M1151_01660 [Candidatus Thermoplasmatota archaeon]|nr:hypothetical protein [Candidatus Thermoplasmatota archaeon]MCL5785361.1 hypothetical protein [Candidatus Thermoplasmatota archaeon]